MSWIWNVRGIQSTKDLGFLIIRTVKSGHWVKKKANSQRELAFALGPLGFEPRTKGL